MVVRIVGFLFLTIYGYVFSWAQSLESDNHLIDISVPQVSLLSADDEAFVHFDVHGPTEAGLFVTTLHDSTIKLKYSTVAGSNSSYSVFARIDTSPLAQAFRLNLEASNYSTGEGLLGNSQGIIQLSTSWQPVVTDIGTCYTGSDPSAGRQMMSSLEVISTSSIQAGNQDGFKVFYTITD